MTKRLLTMVLLASMALGASACASASDVEFIPEGDSYAADALPVALEESAPGATARVAADEAAAVRQDALASLRTNGDEAALLADMLTREFPADVAAVPYLVERGKYDGEDAWIVYEAWGEPGDKLAFRRVWAFALADYTVLAAHSTR